MRNAVLLPVLLLGALAWLGCGSGGGTPGQCSGPDRCALTDHCIQGMCVANTAPTAAIQVPGDLQAYALHDFDGSTSSDPDTGDAIASHTWTFSAVEAPCAAPVVAGTGAVARVRFACSGRYAVQLVVKDSKGVESAPAEREVAVLPYAGTPMVRASEDLSLDHRCSGEPLRCIPAADVTVGSTAAESPVGPVALHWTVEPPPGRELDASRRVTFTPGADAPAPAVLIETDGTAISGDWVLRVEARDAAGPLGWAAVRVSIGNSPPAVTVPESVAVPHAFDVASRSFGASGSFPVSVTDPDGDPIAPRSVVWHHAGDGQSTFEGEDLGDRVIFRISVPFRSPEDGANLIGGDGLSRAVQLAVEDVNGARSDASVPVLVGNRPPELAAVPTSVRVNHAYDTSRARYVASALLSRWQDPDGDPLWQASGTGDADCPTFTLQPDGASVVQCSRAFLGTPRLSGFAGFHLVSERVRDPWAASGQSSDVYVEILNRPPAASDSTSSVQVSCPRVRDEDLCCKYVLDRCVAFPTRIEAASYSFTPPVSDEDGDPLEIRYDSGLQPGLSVCTPGDCPPARGTLSGALGCNVSPTGETRSYTVTDGISSAAASHTVSRSCR